MYRLLILSLGSIFALIFVTQIYAQEASKSNTLYTEQELIVHFKENSAPHILEPHAAKRDELRQTMTGRIHLFITDTVLTFQDKVPPEESLAHIAAVDDQVGALNRAPMFDTDESSQQDTYLVTLDGTVSIETAIQAYESLEEVEYAQPNYLYNTQLGY